MVKNEGEVEFRLVLVSHKGIDEFYQVVLCRKNVHLRDQHRIQTFLESNFDYGDYIFDEFFYYKVLREHLVLCELSH